MEQGSRWPADRLEAIVGEVSQVFRSWGMSEDVGVLSSRPQVARGDGLKTNNPRDCVCEMGRRTILEKEKKKSVLEGRKQGEFYCSHCNRPLRGCGFRVWAGGGWKDGGLQGDTLIGVGKLGEPEFQVAWLPVAWLPVACGYGSHSGYGVQVWKSVETGVGVRCELRLLILLNYSYYVPRYQVYLPRYLGEVCSMSPGTDAEGVVGVRLQSDWRC